MSVFSTFRTFWQNVNNPAVRSEAREAIQRDWQANKVWEPKDPSVVKSIPTSTYVEPVEERYEEYSADFV